MKLFRTVIWAIVATLSIGSCCLGEEAEGETNAFPYGGIEYVDDTFELTSLNTYCQKSPSGHGYQTFIAVRFDISEMSEDGRYWLLKDQGDFCVHTFDLDIYLENEENSIDFQRMSLLTGEYSDTYIYAVYYTPDEYRYRFTEDNTEYTVSLTVYQTESITGDTYEDTWYVNHSFGDIFLPMLDGETEFTEEAIKLIKEGKGMDLNN